MVNALKTRMTGKRVSGALLAAVMLGACTTSQAGASSGPPTQTPVTVYPSDAQGNRIDHPGYWVISARPGSTTTLYAVIGDVSKQAATIHINAVDAVNSLFGGLSYALPNAPRRGVGAWVRLPRGAVTVGGNKGAVIRFKVVVPTGVKPGQYVGGVSAYVPSGIRQKSGKTQVIVQPRVVTAVQVNVPGAQHAAFSVDRVRPEFLAGAFWVVPYVRNSGNVLLKGHAFLWVYKTGHKGPIIFKSVDVGTTLPFSDVRLPVQLSKHPARTTYRWVMKLTWAGGAVTRSGAFAIK